MKGVGGGFDFRSLGFGNYIRLNVKNLLKNQTEIICITFWVLSNIYLNKNSNIHDFI